MKILIVVTHLLGTGHLSRALTLARAFNAQGDAVTLASGGMPVPQLASDGANVVQLPPLRSDGVDFTTLLDQHGHPADESLLTERRTRLCTLAEQFAPDVVVTELFPFGRRILADEFLALLDAARALPRPPIVLSSIRDILAPPSKPSKAERADSIVAQYYDAVLVHSDPNTTTLERSWPVSQLLSTKLRYTGYVAPPAAGPHPERSGSGEILVSAGGGAVGDPIFRTALQAASLDPSNRWRLLVGGHDPARVTALQNEAPENAVVEAARPDFRQMLHHARASVSMCGYNTALDLLQAGTPSVLIPFDAGKEVEQGLRAESLAELSGMAVLRSADLSPQALLEAIRTVEGADPRPTTDLLFDGANRSAAIARQLVEARR